MKKLMSAAVVVLFSLAASAETLSVNKNKALILDFESEVKYVDFGNGELYGNLLSHKNMLELRCAETFSTETNLSVVTANGRYHTFTVSYSDSLSSLAWTEKSSFVQPDTVYLSGIKTTHFICAQPISDVICGSDFIIAEYADDISNIVRAKAMESDFPETSFTAISSLGEIFSFVVKPCETPERVNIYLSEQQQVTAIFQETSVNDVQMKSLGEQVSAKAVSITNIGNVKQNMEFALYGLYCQNDVLMFNVKLKNNNRLDYEIDFIKCYIKDKKRSKTITVQEDEIKPLYVYIPPTSGRDIVPGGETFSAVLFFKRFTIPPKRILFFEVFEKNGGRHISFPVSDKEILKAEIL